VSNWGVRINNGRVQGPGASSSKLHKYITQTGEYSIEAWLVPANVTQDGPARIVSYSGSDISRNFTLGQTMYNYNFFNRSTTTDENGSPTVSTPDAAEVLQATLQHVVVSYDLINGRSIYVNGNLIIDDDPSGAGLLTDWDDSFVLVLGNETSQQYPWQGTIRFLAIHNRALTPEQIQGNYDVGVGQKILVAFAIDHLIDDMSDAYIVFQMEQFDDYSYLLNNPYFYSFTETPSSEIHIQGLRIGLNGREAPVGQAYANLDIRINSSNYDVENGVALSDLGTIIELEKGPDQDQFFLGFDRINTTVTGREEVVTPPAPEREVIANDTQPRIGVRTFNEINASLSSMTGISMNNPSILSTYQVVQQQMPAAEDVKGFLVAHQMGVTQLSVKYCNILAQDSAKMATFFPDFSGNNFGVFDGSADPVTQRRQIIEPLLAALVSRDVPNVGTQLANQPLVADSYTRLNDLINTMTTGCSSGTCSDSVTENTITAVCAAALGSAVMMVQ